MWATAKKGGRLFLLRTNGDSPHLSGVVPEDVKLETGITPELVRFSAGLEDADDLIADF